MKLSAGHINRKLHNWLAYNNSDKFLIKFSPLYRGFMCDLGCGEAYLKDFFLQYAERYVGIDWSESEHEVQADVIADLNRSIPIAGEVVDTVISISVLEHLCEPQKMLDEAFRILKPGGHFVLQVPWQWWVHEAPNDFFRYSSYGLSYMFQKAGFRDVVVYPQSGFFTTIVMKVNYFTLRLIKGPKIWQLLVRLLLLPLWTVGQVIAPWLDKLDLNWSLESSGYFVTAHKRQS